MKQESGMQQVRPSHLRETFTFTWVTEHSLKYNLNQKHYFK